MRINKDSLAELGFVPMNDDKLFCQYLKRYDSIATIVFFDHLYGTLIGVRFISEDELAAFLAGDLIVSTENFPAIADTKIVKIETFDLLTAPNLNRVVTLKNLKRAISMFERSIERQIMGVDTAGFEVGDRVIRVDKENVDVATVTSIGDRINLVFSDGYVFQMRNFKKIVPVTQVCKRNLRTFLQIPKNG